MYHHYKAELCNCSYLCMPLCVDCSLCTRLRSCVRPSSSCCDRPSCSVRSATAACRMPGEHTARGVLSCMINKLNKLAGWWCCSVTSVTNLQSCRDGFRWKCRCNSSAFVEGQAGWYFTTPWCHVSWLPYKILAFEYMICAIVYARKPIYYVLLTKLLNMQNRLNCAIGWS